MTPLTLIIPLTLFSHTSHRYYHIIMNSSNNLNNPINPINQLLSTVVSIRYGFNHPLLRFDRVPLSCKSRRPNDRGIDAVCLHGLSGRLLGYSALHVF